MGIHDMPYLARDYPLAARDHGLRIPFHLSGTHVKVSTGPLGPVTPETVGSLDEVETAIAELTALAELLRHPNQTEGGPTLTQYAAGVQTARVLTEKHQAASAALAPYHPLTPKEGR